MNKIYVVEGLHDEEKLKSIFKDIKTVSINGSEINQKSLELIIELSKTHEIILALDPDYSGTRIRNILESKIGNVKHIFFDKKDAVSKNGKKVGIEHINGEIIKTMIKHEVNNLEISSDLTPSFLHEVRLTGNINSSNLREMVSNHFHIGHTNSKTLLKRLKWLGVNQNDIIEVLNAHS